MHNVSLRKPALCNQSLFLLKASHAKRAQKHPATDIVLRTIEDHVISHEDNCTKFRLTCALLLQLSGYSVTIYTKASPDSWSTDEKYTSPKAVASLNEYRNQEWDQISFDTFKKLVDDKEVGLMLVPALEYSKNTIENLWYENFVPDFQEIKAKDLPVGQNYGFKFQTYCINVPKYLQWVLNQFKLNGGKIKHKTFKSIHELNIDNPDVVLNCSGLQAQSLNGVNDKLVYATRGQTVIVKAPKVYYTVTAGDAEDLQANDFTYVVMNDLQPCTKTADAIIERCVKLCPELLNEDGKVDIIGHKVGLRPSRIGGVRLEGKVERGNSREKNLYLAKLAEQGGRYNDMQEFITALFKDLAVSNEAPTVEERELFAIASKNVVGDLRETWYTIELIVKRLRESESDEEKLQTALDYQNKLKDEITLYCNLVVDLIDKNLIPSTKKDVAALIFFHKMKADYLRYLAEISTEEKKEQLAVLAKLSYTTAADIASTELPPTHPTRLGLVLNYSVFHYDILNSVEAASIIAKQGFDDALAEIDALEEHSYK
ncbi:14-3-3 protein, partial [Clydaea vesicula]